MKLGVLFSGGKDSTLATWYAKKYGHDVVCLISVFSKNKDSFMFHTPSISKVEKQAEMMNVPLIYIDTQGEKEVELRDLKKIIKDAKDRFGIEGIVTGAVESVYQSSRIQVICNLLDLECFNPLWQKEQFELLYDLIKNKFKVIITGVAAYPLGKDWIGKEIDKDFINEIIELNKKYKINPAGEGGEFESFVIDCPLFDKGLKVKDIKVYGSGNSWKGEVLI